MSSTINVPEMNFQAVLLMHDGFYDQACQSLSKALVDVRETLSSASFEDKESVCGDGCFQAPASCYFLEASSAQLYGEDQITKPFIFKQAALLTNTPPSIKVDETRSFVLIYNLALTFHLKALSGGRSSQAHMNKARVLYNQAVQIQRAENLPVSAQHSMAIYNNLGHVCSCLELHDEMQYCFQCVLTTLMYVKEYVGGKLDDNLDCFLGNVIPLILKCRSASAA